MDLNLNFEEHSSISQFQRLDSFIPVVLLTVTARSLPAIIKYKTRNCSRNCGRRAPARLVWTTGTPSLLTTPGNYHQSKQNLASIRRHYNWFRVVTGALEINWNWNTTSKKITKDNCVWQILLDHLYMFT